MYIYIQRHYRQNGAAVRRRQQFAAACGLGPIRHTAAGFIFSKVRTSHSQMQIAWHTMLRLLLQKRPTQETNKSVKRDLHKRPIKELKSELFVYSVAHNVEITLTNFKLAPGIAGFSGGF